MITAAGTATALAAEVIAGEAGLILEEVAGLAETLFAPLLEVVVADASAIQD